MKISPRLLIIAPHSSYRIAPYLQAAESLGVDVTIASAGEHSLISVINKGLHINFAEPEQALAGIIKAAEKTPFAGILGTDDMSVALAANAAKALGLTHNPPEAALLARRKDTARTCLQKNNVLVPAHRRIELAEPITSQLAALEYPCVLKPLAMSGSRGVIRVDDLESAQHAIARIITILREVEEPEEAAAVLAETFIAGYEVAYEGLLSNGELNTLALFDKPDPLNGPYFEESYYISPSRLSDDVQKEITDTVAAACQAYGLRQGPVHAELRIDANNKAWVMEIAARTIGGECARLVELATGQKLEKLVLADLLNLPLPSIKFKGGAGVLMIPIPRAGILRRIEGITAARSVKGIEEVVISVRDGHELVPLPEGSSYLGFIYAITNSAAEAESALREAHRHLNIVTAPLFKIAGAPS
ncbi:MAG: ATP-grasp domain-containing protein [Sulfuriflexus sp.]|nr:ATP-grasp domain-containing protein [Sulfuriflexus sp.]